jgi:glycosyltransferase involved in cell wall biosynthesis
MEIIHIVLGKANPERMNGVNKVVHQLATKQVAFDVKASVWGIANDQEMNYGERNFETLLFLKQRNPFAVSKALKKAILEKKGTAIFHLHGGWIPVYYSLSKFLHSCKIPFVFTPHGTYTIGAMERNALVKKLYLIFFEKTLLNNTAKIHCLGKSEVFNLQNIFHNNKSILLPYGYENDVEVIMKNPNKKEFIFGFIGRLDTYHKGLDIMIDAFELFESKNSDVKLWIVGDSEERLILEKKVKAKFLFNKIIFFGSKFGNEKEDVLQKMDVFIHSSRTEGLPVSVIEAASFGKPCIVTAATNIGDLLVEYKAGICITSNSSIKLADAMHKMYTSSENQILFSEMQHNAIKMVKDNYNWKKLITQFSTDLYQI